MNIENISFQNDEPSQSDSLGRQELLFGISKIIQQVKPPMVIGIHGEWGSGKTSFLIALQNLLSKEKRASYPKTKDDEIDGL